MLTDRGALLLIGSTVLVSLGFLLDAWVAAAAALPLALTLAAAIVAFALAEPAPVVEGGVEPTRELIGDHPRVMLKLSSRVPFLGGALEIVDDPPDGLKANRGANAALVRIPNRGVVITYDLECPVRGRFTFKSLRWRWTSPLGVFVREGVVETPTEITVLPRWDEGEFGTLRPPRRSTMGLLHVAASGQGSEFYGIRDYQPGDPFRAINWKATAREGKPLVNEFEREVPSDIVFLLDARADAAAGDASENPLEVAIREIASLSHHFLQQGSRVGLVVLNARPRYLHPDRGTRQLDRILEELLEVQPEGDMPLAHVVAVVPPEAKATGILFVNSARDASLADATTMLAERYRATATIVPVNSKETSLHPLSKEALPAAERARRLEIDSLRDYLRRAGVPAVLWDVKEPLAPAIEEVSTAWS